MKVSPLKIVPTAVTLAAAGFCAWPYLDGGEPAAGGAASPSTASRPGPEIAEAMLRPALAPKPARDPFEDREALRAAARESIAAALKRLIAARQVALALAKKQRLTTGKRASGAATVTADAKAGDALAAPRVEPADPLRGLVLAGTSVSGARGVALINGRAYVTGEAVAAPGLASALVLAEVRKDRVLLGHDGKIHTLPFATPARGAGSAVRAAAKGRDADPGRAGPGAGPAARRNAPR